MELITGLAAIAIAVISLGTSIYFSKKAQEHNRKSVLPIPYLDRSDFEEKLHIRIYNKGTGPMIVTGLCGAHPEAGGGHIVDLVPPPPEGFMFSNFSHFTENRTIRPGEYNDLLAGHFDLTHAAEIAYQAQLRLFLKDLTVHCEYTDVYGSHFQPYEAACGWFGRHFE